MTEGKSHAAAHAGLFRREVELREAPRKLVLEAVRVARDEPLVDLRKRAVVERVERLREGGREALFGVWRALRLVGGRRALRHEREDVERAGERGDVDLAVRPGERLQYLGGLGLRRLRHSLLFKLRRHLVETERLVADPARQRALVLDVHGVAPGGDLRVVLPSVRAARAVHVAVDDLPDLLARERLDRAGAQRAWV